MPRLDRLPPANRKTLLDFPSQVNETAPFTRPARSLRDSTLALVTTAGLHRRGDRPFAPGEQGYRVIAAGTPAADILQSHTSLGYDRVPIIRDLNISFPIDRVQELVTRGDLGARAPYDYSFMGALRDTAKLDRETGPEVGRRLREEGVDVALITPT